MNEKGKSNIYFARLTFYKDTNAVKLEVRPTKKGRKIKKVIDIPENINSQELYWEKIRNRYMKGTFAIYERARDSNGQVYYTNSGGTISHESLNHRLESLLIESFEIKIN